MTFTILAHDPATDQTGIGIATASLAVGGLCPFMTLSGDLITSQAFARQEVGLHTARRLSDGMAWPEILHELAAEDPYLSYRQLGVVTRDGGLHAHTGPDCRPYAAHLFAPDCVVMGNFLAGAHVLDAMAAAFAASVGRPLAERLLQSLEAGRDAGGQADGEGRRYTERSAGLKVVGGGGMPGIDDRATAPVDLRVDMHDRAVGELRRLHDTLQQVPRYNALRSANPPETPPLAEWEAANAGASSPPSPLLSRS